MTSIGESGGERRRIQARVASYIGAQLFPVGGILAINGIKVNNTAIVSGVLGSNGQIALGNNSVVTGGIELGTASTPPPILGNGSTLGGPGDLPLGGGGRLRARAGGHGQHRRTANDNGRITSGQDAGSNVTYTNTAASPRTLSIGNNGSLTLGGGTYNFCKVTLGNNSYITIAAGAKVRFFLDSPDRGWLGLHPVRATTGRARRARTATAAWFSARARTSTTPATRSTSRSTCTATPTASHKVEFNNTSAMNAAIYAPTSKLVWKNTAGITGGSRRARWSSRTRRRSRGPAAAGGFSLVGPADRHGLASTTAWLGPSAGGSATATSDPSPAADLRTLA